MAHTPGPWPKDYVQAAVRHVARNCDFIESQTDPEFGWDRSNDAGVIEAAPDGYALAVAVVDTLEPTDPYTATLRRMALALIAKAERR